jgi:hypothetical protein
VRAVLAAVSLLTAGTGTGPKRTVVTCTNPSSGATWTIAIDFAHGLVDSFPAQIAAGRITWRDTLHGGIYELERRSGALTVRFPSSTGGYFLHDRCDPAP